MRKFDHFNLISPIYDLIFHGNRTSKIFELIEANQRHTLLDVGGGTGRISSLFSEITPNVIIADSALSMLKEAKKKGLHSINAVSEKLPLNNNAFDRIVIIDALHHVVDQKQTIKEMWRLLKPGGRIIIEEPDFNHWTVKLLALLEKLLLMRSHFLEPEMIADLFYSVSGDKKFKVRYKRTAWIIIDKDEEN